MNALVAEAKTLTSEKEKSSEEASTADHLPNGWQYKPLFSVLSVPSGQVDPRQEPYRSMVLVAPDHVEGRTGRLLQKRTAAEQLARSGKYEFKPGDIVYSKIRPHLKKAILADFHGLCSADMYPLRPLPGIVPGYLFAVILGEHFSKYAESVSVRSGMPKINRAELADYTILIPKNEVEQRAIADALRDADALIESLEQLIAKKRAVKQGAMQDLLSGRRRLPGFSRKWHQKPLGDGGTFFKGSGVRRDQAQSGDLPCIRYGELYTHHNDLIRRFNSWISKEVAATARKVLRGDILFAGSGETKDEIGKCAVLDAADEAYAGGDVIVFRPREDDPIFLGYYLNSASVQSQKAAKGQGDAVVHISSRALADLELVVPERDEQTAIAQVLLEMDAELDVLELRLQKARQIKQGMMQELLTGRVRLV